MNFTETIKSGQHYRVFDKLNTDGTRHYNRYSFVTNAADVIFEDGTNVEAKLGGSSGSLAAINKEIADLKKSVSDGKKAVAAAVTANGVTTATDAAFSVIANNINTAAANKYNAGIAYADGRVNTDSANYKSGYNAGYAAGKTVYPATEFLKYFIPNSVSTAYTEDSNTITYNVSELSSITWTLTAGFGENEDGDSSGWIKIRFNDEDVLYWNNFDGDDTWENTPPYEWSQRTFSCVGIDTLKVEVFVHSATSRWAAATFKIVDAST